MTTPHISCEKGDIAELVLMPGDPRRAKRIAESFLDDARLVSDVRGNNIFTGKHRGTPMSVMASGMGVPTTALYATELFRFYGVKRICRVGTTGGISSKVKVRDVIIANAAHTNSSIATIHVPGINLSLAASFDMLRGAVAEARATPPEGAQVHVGAVYSSDFFYLDRPDIVAGLDRMGTLGVEMESAALFQCALAEDAEALTVLTVSDHLKDGSGDMDAEERETRFGDALRIATAGLLA
ncbi:DeoD-type purine-nucleoside phosphorylase [Luteococcus sp. OSA5]|uniref:purine-nucleoside phosphorylase n=1 Tax=Luteococcus sp. OSA5 TaxID=3401630 RepID=UPI003B432248